jgi:predicted sulfurtransferase/23S rRNA-/tRNA-specific pseudouridylate synthase
MPRIVNIAAYRFAALGDLLPLKRELARLCHDACLKGTILLSAEGINLFVAGERAGIDRLLSRIRTVDGLAEIEVKESFSDEQPFNRMLVKIKKEIIAFGIDGIDPRHYTSRRVSAEQLKQWLDQGRPITLLDTRNDFEVASGTFEGAIAVGVDDFRDFPDAVNRLPDELKRQPVVTFCTGGIRCEKAAPYLERAGFLDVYQLDGGILKYFERVGGAHYHGDCFVFDKRVALDPSLKPSGVVQCFVCQAVLTAAEAALPTFVEGVSCPRCWRSPDESMAQLIARRHESIRAATTPLPGGVPYDNVRPISVPLKLDGYEVLDFFDAMHTHLSRDEWREACMNNLILCRGEIVRPGRIVRAGDRLLHTMPATREPDVNADIRIVHEDDAIVVIDKPAPLPMHPCGRFNRNTLSHILEQVFRPLHLRPVHRLDADTSGLVLFAKTREIARELQVQFQSGSVRKRYLATVKGSPASDLFECDTPLSDELHRHGTGAVVPDDGGGCHDLYSNPGSQTTTETQPGRETSGPFESVPRLGVPSRGTQACLTRFRVIERHTDGTTTLEAEPITGRTHQIRIHLASLGLPIVGETFYDGESDAETFARLPTDPPLHLRAATLEFDHPATGARLRFSV